MSLTAFGALVKNTPNFSEQTLFDASPNLLRRKHYAVAMAPISAAVFCLCSVNAANAQPTTADEEDVEAAFEDVVVVAGKKVRGRSLSDIEPELVLSEEDISAYGVSTLGELLEAVLAETSSSRGRGNQPPVVLVNGRRVSGFR
ncbi:MAG: hypothetical protein AAGA22_07380, partial [Pseudomonadota bacterium]